MYSINNVAKLLCLFAILMLIASPFSSDTGCAIESLHNLVLCRINTRVNADILTQ